MKGEKVWIRRINEKRGEVGYVVDDEDEGIDGEKRQLEGGVESRYESEEHVEGEDQEEYPAENLLGMKWELQTMYSTPLAKLLFTICHHWGFNIVLTFFLLDTLIGTVDCFNLLYGIHLKARVA